MTRVHTLGKMATRDERFHVALRSPEYFEMLRKFELAGLARDPPLGRALGVEWSSDLPASVELVATPPRDLGESPFASRDMARTAKSRPRDLVGPWIAWMPSDGTEDVSERPPRGTRGLLDEFIQLPDAPADAVVRFVRRWGPLELCEHLLPATHARCLPIDSIRSPASWEPVAAIRSYARRFRDLFTLVADVEAGEPVDASRWLEAVADSPLAWLGPDAVAGLTKIDGRGVAGGLVNELMALSPVASELRWSDFDRRPRLVLAGRTFGILAYQLGTAIGGASLDICSNCKSPYVPVRRPQKGRDHYCHACRGARKAAYKRRQQDRFRKERG